MDFKRLFDILPYQQARYPQEVALAHQEATHWKSYSTEECIDMVNRVSAGLLEQGLVRKDKVLLLVHCGSPFWNFLDLGMQQIGVIVIPIHATVPTKELSYIINDAQATLAIVSNQAMYDKIAVAKEEGHSLKKIYSIESLANVRPLEELLIKPSAKHLAQITALKTAIQEEDLATILYTSGTTGTPKGVRLSHKNIVSNIKATISLVPINCEKRVVSFLPLSHILERMVVYTYLAVGASIYYVDRPEVLMDRLQEIQPQYFTCVPRVLEKMYDGILTLAATKGKLGRRIIHWSLSLAERYPGRRKMGMRYRMLLFLADVLVYRHWRKAMGGKIEGIMVGAAALQEKLCRIFAAAGIEVREGYGLTETAPVIAFNRFEPGGVRYGTVGIPIPGIELKIVEANEKGEGEIVVKGPNVMMGYYQKEALTQEVLDKDGWFSTGDIGQIVHKRFLKITDRKKDIFKTTSGKYVAPQVVENVLLSSRYISQCMVVGFNRPYVIALIVPAFTQLKLWCEENKVHWTSPQFMVLNPKIKGLMEKEIATLNEGLRNVEKVRRIKLLYEDWTVERGELTTTMKLRRAHIVDKYQQKIAEAFRN
ncbi:MAG: long-chain fatty acid--CoA ligase [Saprospiraceae bacterium]